MAIQVRCTQESVLEDHRTYTSAKLPHLHLLICHCSFSLRLPIQLAPQTRSPFLASRHLHQILLLLAFLLLSTSVLSLVRNANCTTIWNISQGTEHHQLCCGGCRVQHIIQGIQSTACCVQTSTIWILSPFGSVPTGSRAVWYYPERLQNSA